MPNAKMAKVEGGNMFVMDDLEINASQVPEVYVEPGATVTDIQIDFEQDIFDFVRGKETLRIITHKAAAQGLLSTAHIKRGFALDHFYSTQNISHNLALPETISYDEDAETDPGLNEIRSYTTV